jgi:hypothetical protein
MLVHTGILQEYYLASKLFVTTFLLCSDLIPDYVMIIMQFLNLWFQISKTKMLKFLREPSKSLRGNLILSHSIWCPVCFLMNWLEVCILKTIRNNGMVSSINILRWLWALFFLFTCLSIQWNFRFKCAAAKQRKSTMGPRYHDIECFFFFSFFFFPWILINLVNVILTGNKSEIDWGQFEKLEQNQVWKVYFSH